MAIFTATLATAIPDARVLEIPEGAQGIAATLSAMVDIVREYRINPRIRALAESLIAALPGKDYRGEAEAIHAYVRDQIRYTQDVYDVETLKTPTLTLDSGQGDCDDKAVLFAALMQSIGHPCRFVAVGFRGPGEYSHVFCETKIGPRWIAAECTEDVPLGWRPLGVSPAAVMIRHI